MNNEATPENGSTWQDLVNSIEDPAAPHLRESEECDEIFEDLASNAGQAEAKGAPCEDCGEVHDEENFDLNELQGGILQFMEAIGLNDLVKDLKQTIADQREHQERMGRTTEQLVNAIEQADSRLEGGDRVEWALMRLECGCLVPTLRVGDEWTQTSERFAEIATSEQVRQIVEAMALLGKDLLNVMKELQEEGR